MLRLGLGCVSQKKAMWCVLLRISPWLLVQSTHDSNTGKLLCEIKYCISVLNWCLFFSTVQVKAFVPGGPAFRCGMIQIGDVLTHVGGTAVAQLSTAQLSNLILG